MSESSRISETDLHLFSRLVNPQASAGDDIDTILAKLQPMVGTRGPYIEEIGVEEPDQEDVPSRSTRINKTKTPPLSPIPPSPKRNYFQEAMNAQDPYDVDPDIPIEEADGEDPELENICTGEAPPVDWKRVFKDTEFVPEDFTDVDVDAENRNPQIRREKQEVLFQLLKRFGSSSKGQWNMRLPLWELQYELKRQTDFVDEIQQLEFMKELLKLILVGVEVLNKKFGPYLELDGWAAYVTRDMSRFDRCLSALYLKYFRKAKMSPIMELCWLIVGSAAMWHIQIRFLGIKPDTQQTATTPIPNPTHSTSPHHPPDITPPPGLNGGRVPFANPGTQTPKFNLGDIIKLFSGGVNLF